MPHEPSPASSRPIRAGTLLTVALLAGVAIAGGMWLRPVAPPAERSDPAVVHRVDVNRAGAAEIAVLPGIGDVLAGRIVSDRDARGPFGRIGDLERVHGIGPRIVERIRAHVALDPERP
jgi:competence ComEA-like helix-hairpin-helix protein